MINGATRVPRFAFFRLPGWRATLLFAFLLLALLGLFGRAIYLQLLNNDFLQDKGNKRYGREIEVPAHRGVIHDRNGVPLAVSTPVKAVWATPASVKASDLQLQQLAQALDMDEAELRKRLSDTSREYVYLKRQLPPQQAEVVAQLGVDGILLQSEYRRFYPTAEASAQLLGFTGVDDNGQEGLELALQTQLGGRAGSRRVLKDRRGHVVEDEGSLRQPKPGRDVTLSIDSKMQYVAFRELQNAVLQQHAKAGALVVLDTRSGEVLALANYPSYNPNNHERVPAYMMRNRAVTDVFEPGSTMKPFTIATAIDAGLVTPEMSIGVQGGQLTIGKQTIHDTHRYTNLSVAQVIQKSSNVGSAKIALMMQKKTLWNGLAGSGFGEPTGSGFPGEATGKLRDPESWHNIEQATMSFGHGLSVNLLQLARAYSIFANNGELKPVSLVRRNGEVSGARVFSEQTAQQVRDMLELVVKPGGTAPLAQVPGYRVAGKTGTAHKLEGKKYVERYVASFVGFAPASAPRVVVAVMIDEPGNGAHYGGVVAAPVFSRVMERVLQLLDVPRDAPLNNVIIPGKDLVKEDV